MLGLQGFHLTFSFSLDFLPSLSYTPVKGGEIFPFTPSWIWIFSWLFCVSKNSGDFIPLGWRDRTTYRSYSQICFNELRMIINCVINFIFDETIDNFGCIHE